MVELLFSISIGTDKQIESATAAAEEEGPQCLAGMSVCVTEMVYET